MIEKGRVEYGIYVLPRSSKKWGISERRVQKLCEENRIPGISKIGYMWLIPQNAEKPKDNRKKADT